MSEELNISISSDGAITRDKDNKHLADVDLATGKVKYTNPAYAKGDYKQAIQELAGQVISLGKSKPTGKAKPEVATKDKSDAKGDPRVPSAIPPRDKVMGDFSAAHINYDHANLSDKEFSTKYKNTALCQLEFIAYRPELFADRTALEERFAKLLA